MPEVLAAACMSASIIRSILGELPSINAKMRDAFGAAARRSSMYFVDSSEYIKDSPVMLPPGRDRLRTRPAATGSPLEPMTIGIVVVACFAASMPAVDQATI